MENNIKLNKKLKVENSENNYFSSYFKQELVSIFFDTTNNKNNFLFFLYFKYKQVFSLNFKIESVRNNIAIEYCP